MNRLDKFEEILDSYAGRKTVIPDRDYSEMCVLRCLKITPQQLSKFEALENIVKEQVYSLHTTIITEYSNEDDKVANMRVFYDVLGRYLDNGIKDDTYDCDTEDAIYDWAAHTEEEILRLHGNE